MGIELPAELTAVAARAGVTWPKADEDAMRASATAWREAGDKITRLSATSDTAASRAMEGLSGATGDAARGSWSKIVAPDGDLNRAAKGCYASAARLDHAAKQVGAAKVEIVRELVTLAKNTDAAQASAGTGNATALLGLDTLTRGAAANVANLHNTLSSAIRLDSGVDMSHASPPVNTSPGAHGPSGGLLGGVTGIVAPMLDTVTVQETVAPVAGAVAPATAPVAGLIDPIVKATPAPVQAAVEPVLDVVDGNNGNGNGRSEGPGRGQGPTILPAVVSEVGQVAADVVQPVVQPGAQAVPAVQVVGEAIPSVHGSLGPIADGTTQAAGAAVIDRPMMPGDMHSGPAQSAPAASAPAAPTAPTGPTFGNPVGAPAAGPIGGVGGAVGAVGGAVGGVAGSAPVALAGGSGQQGQAGASGQQGQQGQAGAKPGEAKVDAKPGAQNAAVGKIAGGVQGAVTPTAQFAGQTVGNHPVGAVNQPFGQHAPGNQSHGPGQSPHGNQPHGPGQGQGQAGTKDQLAKDPLAKDASGKDGLGKDAALKDAAKDAAAKASAIDPATGLPITPGSQGGRLGVGDPRGLDYDLPNPSGVSLDLDHTPGGVQGGAGVTAPHLGEASTQAREFGGAAGITDRLENRDPRHQALAGVAYDVARHTYTAAAVGSWFMTVFLAAGMPPRLAPKPARQLPPPQDSPDPQAEQIPRFRPQDHPKSELVEPTSEQVAPESAEPAQRAEGLGKDHPAVQELLQDYDPLAGMHEHDWESLFLNEDGIPKWPAEREGGYEDSQPDVLRKGAELDRFGTEEGRVLAKAGTPYAQRSLPPQQVEEGYRRYEVMKDLPVWRTISAPWFGQPGGGSRYRTTYPVADLVALGYLTEITA